MNWFNRAEQRFGHLAIPNLIRVLVGFKVMVFVLYKLVDPRILQILMLNPKAIMAGEVWRLVTYIFIPSIGSPLTESLILLFYVLWLWWIGDGLENAMGSFRVNVFYFVGMLGVTIAAFFTGVPTAAFTIESTLFFAFARFYPEEWIYLMMLVPVKVKWLAWAGGLLLVLQFIGSDWGFRLTLLVAFANYFLFFGREIFLEAAHRRGVSERRRKFEASQRPDEDALHRCAVCGRTEITIPDLEFRVSRDGQEYCVDHLPKPTPPS
jgi:hypothetical protein